MAKIIEYPRASVANALQLAEAVDSLGGSAKIPMAAEKMGRKVSGAFNAVISAAVKYSLIASKDGRLATTPLYRDIKLAYSEQEKKRHLQTALLSPPSFLAIAQRFAGRKLPLEHFDRLLIREFGVTDDMAARVASYFIEGAKQADMLTANNELELENADGVPRTEAREDVVEIKAESEAGNAPVGVKSDEGFSVTFRGPGLSSTVVMRDEDDMAIVEATLRKIKRALQFDRID